MPQLQLVIPEHIWSKKILQLPFPNKEVYATCFINLLFALKKQDRGKINILSGLDKWEIKKLASYNGSADEFISALMLVGLLGLNTRDNIFFIVDWNSFFHDGV